MYSHQYQDLGNNRSQNSPFNGGQSVLMSLSDVSVDFKGCRALSNINFNILKKDFLFVTGPSGAGKTTLLRVLAGKLRPTSGRVDSVVDPDEKFVSVVFQDLKLLEDMSCLENLLISYDPSLYRNKKEFLIECEELCRFFNIWEKKNLKIKDANGGLKQQIAIIRALLSRPDVLLADEPSSSLDLGRATKVFEILNYYNVKKGLTIIWATHNKDLVKSFSGKIVHLDMGKLVYSGNACFI